MTMVFPAAAAAAASAAEAEERVTTASESEETVVTTVDEDASTTSAEEEVSIASSAASVTLQIFWNVLCQMNNFFLQRYTGRNTFSTDLLTQLPAAAWARGPR